MPDVYVSHLRQLHRPLGREGEQTEEHHSWVMEFHERSQPLLAVVGSSLVRRQRSNQTATRVTRRQPAKAGLEPANGRPLFGRSARAHYNC
jgi:hypothetical protein